MKLSKSLLSAIMIGVAVQTAGSCTKDIKKPESKDSKTKTEANSKTSSESGTTIADPCPACGMG